MSSREIAFMSAVELAESIRSKEVSPVEVVEVLLDRIGRLNDQLACFVTICADQAREQARAAESAVMAGDALGPLHGVPYTLKDNIDTAGIRTTVGARFWLDRVPDRDATVQERLRAAGGILLGKVNLHEMAMGVTSDNRQIGITTRNPWDTERVPGGSSGGSAAAVAAGIGPISIGTDTGGSIRGPASLCGIFGLKPTYGRVSRAGVVVNSWSLDHVGPLTRTVGDAALTLAAIAGHDRKDPASSRRPVDGYLAGLEADIAGSRIGVLTPEQLAPCWPAVRQAYQQAVTAMGGLGATLEPIRLELLDYCRQSQRMVASPETAQAHGELIRRHPEQFGADIRNALEIGSMALATDYIRGQRLRSKLRDEFRRALGRVDVIVTPTLIRTAPKIGELTTALGDGSGIEEDMMMAFGRFCNPFNLSGMPSVNIPAGVDESGLPIGLQIAGRPFDEATILRFAAALERAGFASQTPPIARLEANEQSRRIETTTA